MKIFGLTITKASVPVTQVPATAIGQGTQSWWGMVRETFAGAWQSRIVPDAMTDLTTFSAVYSCVRLISSDIAKLCIDLQAETSDGIWQKVKKQTPLLNVLRKPNRYQTRLQFLQQWMTSKLLYGNTYVLKERDNRRVVVAMYVLDPRLVKVLVADDGGVYYSINTDKLAGVADGLTVPASEIIHDRDMCLWHPLVGISPIYACGASSTQGARIQANSAKFFENMSRPSGVLSAPGTIKDETANRIKSTFEQNFSGSNIGRLFVAGDGLKYEPMTIPASDAQLIEQLRWTVEDVARAFHVPLYKINAGEPPKHDNINALNDSYYAETLQIHIESIESLLDEGLNLSAGPEPYAAVFNLDGLLRMDEGAQATANAEGIKAGYLSPNEARKKVNLPPVAGGESPYMQQQQFPLEVLAKQPPPNMQAPAPTPAPAPAPEPNKAFDDIAALIKGLQEKSEADIAALRESLAPKQDDPVEAVEKLADELIRKFTLESVCG